MRDRKTGDALVGAHILGFMRRITKLLYFGIKPVFVFDGDAPALKKRTIAERKKRKTGAGVNVAKTAAKLLAAQLRAAALDHASKRAEKQKDLEAAMDTGEQIGDDANYLDDMDDLPGPLHRANDPSARRGDASKSKEREMTPPPVKKYVAKDQYALPSLDGNTLTARANPTDDRIATENDLKNFIQDMRPEDFDISSEIFDQLPVEVRYEIIGDLRLQSRQGTRRSYKSNLGHQVDDLDFSKNQIKNLMQRNILTQKLFEVTDQLGQGKEEREGHKKAGPEKAIRVSGQKNREYILVKQGHEKGGGWILGQDNPVLGSRAPIILGGSSEDESGSDRKNDSTDDDDFEEVAVDTQARRSVSPDAQTRRALAISALRARYVPSTSAPIHDRYLDAPSFVTPESASLAAALFGDDENVGEGEQAILQQALLESAQTAANEEDEWEQVPAELSHAALAPKTTAPQYQEDEDELEYLEEDDGFYEPIPTPFVSSIQIIPNLHVNPFKPAPPASPVVVAPAFIPDHNTDDEDADDFDEVKVDASPLRARKKSPPIPSERTAPKIVGSSLSFPNPFDLPPAPQLIPNPFDPISIPPAVRVTVQGPLPSMSHSSFMDKMLPVESESESDDEFLEVAVGPSPPKRLVELDVPKESTIVANPVSITKVIPIVQDDSEEEFAFGEEEWDTVVPTSAALLQPAALTSNTQPLVIVPIPASPIILSPAREPSVSPPRESVSNITLADFQRSTTSFLPAGYDEMSSDEETVEFVPRIDKGKGREIEVEVKEEEKEIIVSPATLVPDDEVAMESDTAESLAAPVEELDKEEENEEEKEIEWERTPTPPVADDARSRAAAEYAAESAALIAADEAEQDKNFQREQDQYADMLSSLRNRKLDDMRTEARADIATLRAQVNNEKRGADGVTRQMANDIKEMLILFGIPYIDAPQEAEAECAELLHKKLVDGIVTDDSDVFLFGGSRIYRNMFNQNKYVECFLLSDLEKELGLDRDKLVRLAYLLGSDYVDGLPGIGPVRAREILEEFEGENGLKEFKNWWSKVQSGQDSKDDNDTAFKRSLKKSMKNLFIEDSWPNPAIAKAYYEPNVNTENEQFSWSGPDLDGLRTYLQTTLSWNNAKTDEILLPLIKRQNERKAGTIKIQATLGDFFEVSAGLGAMAPRKQAVNYQSGRLQNVVQSWRKNEKRKAGEKVTESEIEGSAEEVVAPFKKKRAPRKDAGVKRGPKAPVLEAESEVEEDELMAAAPIASGSGVTARSAPKKKPIKRAPPKKSTAASRRRLQAARIAAGESSEEELPQRRHPDVVEEDVEPRVLLPRKAQAKKRVVPSESGSD